MPYLAILRVSPQGRVEKYDGYQTEAEATVHAQANLASFPSAYVAQNPGGFYKEWLCDPVLKTAIVSPIPAPTAEKIAAEKSAKATAILNTATNKAMRDALWEICESVRGTTPLPTETKNQYTARLKAMLESAL